MASPHEPHSRWADWAPIGLGAVLIVLGAVGGVAGQFGWVGGWVSTIGVALIVIGAVVALWNKVVLPIRKSRKETRNRIRLNQDTLKAILLVKPPVPVRDVDPYAIGVFESDLANTAAKESGKSEPPYVKRHIDIDGRMDNAFSEAALADHKRLVPVLGVPKSGKSRTLWEAVLRNVPNRTLIALRKPRTDGEGAPEHQPLVALLDAGIEASEDGLVVWLDDAHQHVGYGLTVRNLERLVEKYPGAIIAMTFHIGELEGLATVDEPLSLLLEPGSDGLVLDSKLNDDELVRAHTEYPTLVGEEDLAWLPEWFAAVNLLRKRYRNNKGKQPVGVSVVKAAIDWRRAGMPPTIPEATLQELTAITLRDAVPNHILDDETFAAGLTWATHEVAARSALLLRSTEAGGSAYHAFDAVWSWAPEVDGPLTDNCWGFILERLTATTSLGVGAAAGLAGRLDDAQSALSCYWELTFPSMTPHDAFYMGPLFALTNPEFAKKSYRRALDSRDPGIVGEAALRLGELLEEQNPDQAEDFYRQALDSPDAVVVRQAAANLGELLIERDPTEAVRAFNQAIDSVDPESMGEVAFRVGMLLQEDNPKAAQDFYRKAIDSPDSTIAGQSAYNLGVLLREQNPDGAMDAFRTALNSPDGAFVFMAAFNLGVLLNEKNPDEAEDFYRQALNSPNPVVERRAAARLGELLIERSPEEAAEAFNQAINLTDPESIGDAALYFGLLLQEMNPEQAEDFFRIALHSPDGALIGESAYNLGVLVRNRSPDEAERFFRQSLNSPDDFVVGDAMLQLGLLLRDRDPAEAEGFYRQSLDSPNPDIVSAAAFHLGVLLLERNPDGAVQAFYRVLNNPDSELVYKAAFNIGLLLTDKNPDKAVDAYRTALDSPDPDVADAARRFLQDLTN